MNRSVPASATLLERLRTAREYFDNQQYTEAADLFLQALELAPDNSGLCFSAGNALRHTGDYERAATLYRTAAGKRPGFFAAFCNLGAALRELQRFDEAIDALEKAAAVRPEALEPHLQIADLCIRQSRIGEAEAHLNEALIHHPGSAEAENGLGNCAMARHELNAAKEHYHRALRLRPVYAEAHYNLGAVMREWDRLDEAAACYRSAIRFEPGKTAPIVNLGEVSRLLGDTAASETFFREALAIDPECQPAQHNLLVSMNYNHLLCPEAVLAAHCGWGKQFASPPPAPPWRNIPSPGRKLVIGYLSPDFCSHPAAAFLEPMLRHHDRDQFEIRCYAETVHQDQATEAFKKLADSWRTVERMSDRDVADLIRGDCVDLLVDTAGHLNGNRLGVFALRAAPLQISGIGYPGTTGLAAMDYRITDAVIDPPQEQTCAVEKPLRPGNGFCCYKPPDNLPPVAAPPALTIGYITFGSLHTTARLNEAVISRWSAVLRAIPSSRLIICRATLTPSVIARLSGWFARREVDPGRIDFRPVIPSTGHLTVYNDIDITLDTLPWSGHTTACESLIMGVPIITLTGDRQAGRMVSSVLTTAGLPQWIARSDDEFIAIAAQQAALPAKLAAMRTGLRQQLLASPLCEGASYMKNLEEKYRAIWQKWCENQ
ncbi:MAG: tetratricopeptide repeat protein [Chitinispirillaceae bacterium]|nr:tetratricopeptide repeat protein [Chitinispirillaceae bacterium]